MSRPIDHDLQRFRQIVRGKIRDNLRKYITQGELIGRQGKDFVSIPVPNIEIPHFQHGQKGSGGVGQGAGRIGTPVGRGSDDGAPGPAGSEPGGEHLREVEVSLQELAQMLGEELELPRIEPRGKSQLLSQSDKYNSISRRGPESLRHTRRTYKRALKRQIGMGLYDPDNPVIIPERDDRLYRSWKSVLKPQTNAAILYVMDVSGSMTDTQKEIVRTEAFWIDTWLRSQYDGVQVRYVIHDAEAREVDEAAFYHTRESGGTRISSAYRLVRGIVQRDYPVADWNVYCFQFSDGDNWGDDTRTCLQILAADLLPACNLFCYGQVVSPYGSGDYLRDLRRMEPVSDRLVLSEIEDRDAIYESIRTFLGRGR